MGSCLSCNKSEDERHSQLKKFITAPKLHSNPEEKEGPKRALILSGGGAYGSYQVGVLKELLKEGKEYDVITGISVGSLNAAFLAMYPKGKEKDAITDLEKFWMFLEPRDIYKKWGCKLCQLCVIGCGNKKSFLNSKPLHDLIYNCIDPDLIRKSGHHLQIGAVNLNNGKYEVFDEHSFYLVKGVIASSAFPAFFKPCEIHGETYIDSGIRNMVFPIEHTLALGIKEMDIIMCIPENVSHEKPKNALDIAERSIQIMSNEIVKDDLRIEVEEGVKIRIFRPQNTLGPDSPFEFSPTDTKTRIIQGKTDAIRILESKHPEFSPSIHIIRKVQVQNTNDEWIQSLEDEIQQIK